MDYDAILHRLQQLNTLEHYEITPSGEIIPAKEPYHLDHIIDQLVIRDNALANQVSLLAAQVMYWSAQAARARRVVSIQERNFRVWRSRAVVEQTTPPAYDSKWKKPTDKVVEAVVMAAPEYRLWNEKIDKATEAKEIIEGILEAFKSMQSMLRVAVVRYPDDAAPRMKL